MHVTSDLPTVPQAAVFLIDHIAESCTLYLFSIVYRTLTDVVVIEGIIDVPGHIL